MDAHNNIERCRLYKRNFNTNRFTIFQKGYSVVKSYVESLTNLHYIRCPETTTFGQDQQTHLQLPLSILVKASTWINFYVKIDDSHHLLLNQGIWLKIFKCFNFNKTTEFKKKMQDLNWTKPTKRTIWSLASKTPNIP